MNYNIIFLSILVMKNLTAVLALLGLVQVEAINVQSVQQASMMTEETRYIGSNGKPINLA